MGEKLRLLKSYQKRKYNFMKPMYSISTIIYPPAFDLLTINYIYGELVFGERELYKLSKLREECNNTEPVYAI